MAGKSRGIEGAMNRIHIVGRKNQGKTTLILELVGELTRRGYRVGTIKHTRHLHEIDTPGTDSCRHRRQGAAPAAIVTGDLIGLFVPQEAGQEYLERLAPMFADCDLVLVEGDLDGDGEKIEVWRAANGRECLAAGRDDIIAVVTDDPLGVAAPVLPRGDLSRLLAFLEARAVAVAVPCEVA